MSLLREGPEAFSVPFGYAAPDRVVCLRVHGIDGDNHCKFPVHAVLCELDKLFGVCEAEDLCTIADCDTVAGVFGCLCSC